MNPSIGTFIGMDSYQGSMEDPVSLHKYLYANANPVMYTDPSGYLADMSLANTVAAVTVSAILATAVVFHDQVMLNIFSSVRRNMVDATLEQSCTVSVTDWKHAVLGFPAHHFDNCWIVTTVTWLLSWQLFKFINDVKDADENVDTSDVSDEMAEDDNDKEDADTDTNDSQDELCEVYNSIKQSPKYPNGFKPKKNGTTLHKINNKELLQKLRKIESGTWKKVYKDGYDACGNKVSIHYFRSQSGRVFDVKVKQGWSS